MHVVVRPAPAPEAPARRRPGALPARIAEQPAVRALDRRPWSWALLGVLVFALSAWVVVDRYVVRWPDEIWQVDLEVYREGAYSLVNGRQVYDWLTDAPQYLPFTYPPFAALVGTPLLLVPFRLAGYLWALLQLVLLWYSAGVVFRPLLARFGRRSGLVLGAVSAVLVQLQPMQDSLRFGQVNAVLVALCLTDVAGRRAGWWPRGSLVGLATAVKLTPAVFWIHWLVTRRWRPLSVSVGTAALVSVLTALYAPSASAAYWTQAVFDPGRLGPNADTTNQSMRGVLMRLGLSQGPGLTLAWGVCVLVVGYFGYRLASRFERLGDPLAVIATMGMLAFLLSPVSWMHHLWWSMVAIGVLVGDGRDRGRLAAAALAVAVLVSRLPLTGHTMRVQHSGWQGVLGTVEEQAYCWLALAVLAALWWLVARPAGAGAARPGGGEADGRPDATTGTAAVVPAAAPVAAPPVTRSAITDGAVPPSATPAVRPRGRRRPG